MQPQILNETFFCSKYYKHGKSETVKLRVTTIR